MTREEVLKEQDIEEELAESPNKLEVQKGITFVFEIL